MRWYVALLILTGVLCTSGVVLVVDDLTNGSVAEVLNLTEVTGQAPAGTEHTGGPAADAAPAPATEEPEPEPTPETSALAERLDEHVAAAGDVGELAVAVIDRDGALVFDHHAGRALLPASTQKLPVAAAALIALGPDHRYETVVGATAPPGPDGVVHGDLVIVGGGDPTLVTPAFAGVVPDRPQTSLATLADAVASAGVTEVNGRVLGDPSVFGHDAEPRGWLQRYYQAMDGTPTSGLTVNAGRRVVDDGGTLTASAATDPAAETAYALRKLLGERDITVDQGSGVTRGTEPTVEFGRVSSPPVRDLLRYMVQRSDNHLAEALFKTVGLAVASDASYPGAERGTREALAAFEIDWNGAEFADGSGLSRDNRLSAEQLVRLDAAMSESSLASEWRPLMAETGRSGTLRRRLPGTMAQRRVLGKTGSLRDVTTLSGTVLGPNGAGYRFAVLANGVEGSAKQAVRELQNEVMLTLVEDLYGCVRVVDGERPEPAPGRPTGEELTEAPSADPGAYELLCPQQ